MRSEAEQEALDEEQYEADMEDLRREEEIEAFKRNLIEEEIMAGTYEGYYP